MAVEAAYLGLLGTHPKFQSYVDAQSAKATREVTSRRNMGVLEKIQRSLPRKKYERYQSLRERCKRLGRIAVDLQAPSDFNSDLNLASMQTRGLDRLLWVYLRLLFSQHSMELFFDTVSEEKIKEDLTRIETQLDELEQGETESHSAKIRRTLLDNQSTLQERLENYKRASGNYQFVTLELERVENKIKSLAEISVNRQDPEFVSGQIDAVAESMKDTERTMSDLNFVTGLGEVDAEVPELMNEEEIYIVE